MPSITLKVGPIEVSYEGEQAFIEKGLLSIVRELGALPAAASKVAAKGGSGVIENGEAPAIGHTTSQIAQIFSVSSGPDLAMAAAAHLTLSKGLQKLQRGEILAEMKGAAGFYNENHSSNLSSILNGLVKKKQLSPISANVYALPNSIRKEYEDKLKDE